MGAAMVLWRCLAGDPRVGWEIDAMGGIQERSQHRVQSKERSRRPQLGPIGEQTSRSLHGACRGGGERREGLGERGETYAT